MVRREDLKVGCIIIDSLTARVVTSFDDSGITTIEYWWDGELVRDDDFLCWSPPYILDDRWRIVTVEEFKQFIKDRKDEKMMEAIEYCRNTDEFEKNVLNEVERQEKVIQEKKMKEQEQEEWENLRRQKYPEIERLKREIEEMERC